MIEYKFIKIDTILVCEIKDKKDMIYQEDFFSIYELIKENISAEVTLLFLISSDGFDKIIEKKLTVLEKELILEKKVDNFDLFDFIFFNYILEEDKKKEIFSQNNLEQLISVFEQFVKGLKTYRYDTIKHKTFHIKQRRISRKQLEAMKMDFKKWNIVAEYLENEEDEEED